MKKQISRALLGFFAVLVMSAAANAQGARGIKVQVPFDFVAGQKHLPAGSYTVRRVRVDSESALLIQAEGVGAAAVVLTNKGDENPQGASLTFRQHGDRYFLAEVSMPGAGSVRQTPKTGAERRAERETAGRAEPSDAAGSKAETKAESKAGAKKVTVVGVVQ